MLVEPPVFVADFGYSLTLSPISVSTQRRLFLRILGTPATGELPEPEAKLTLPTQTTRSRGFFRLVR